jgi:putative long chain acyl-CoA synthase
VNQKDSPIKLADIVRGSLNRLSRATRNAADLLLDEDIGAHQTPSKVIHTGDIFSLRRYSGGRSDGATILLVPPLMVTRDIYDIAPQLSAVDYLTDHCDPWVVDFGAPEEEPGGHGRDLADHIRAVDEAVAAVHEKTRGPVHLAGYSQGGLFAYQTAALRACEHIASIITFGSPVDLHQNLPFVEDRDAARRVFETLRAGLDAPLEELGRLPSWLTSRGFKALNPVKEVLYRTTLLLELHDTRALRRRAPKRRFLDGDGFVDWPAPALRDFLRIVLEENRLADGGFEVDGRTVSLDRIDCPVLYFAGHTDDFARPPAVSAIDSLAPRATVRGIDVETGHFGLVVGSMAMDEVWPTVAEWVTDSPGLS